MTFTRIDRSTWPREPYFHHYFTQVPCTYSATFRLLFLVPVHPGCKQGFVRQGERPQENIHVAGKALGSFFRLPQEQIRFCHETVTHIRKTESQGRGFVCAA